MADLPPECPFAQTAGGICSLRGLGTHGNEDGTVLALWHGLRNCLVFSCRQGCLYSREVIQRSQD